MTLKLKWWKVETKTKLKAQIPTQTTTEVLMFCLRYHNGQAMTRYLQDKTDTFTRHSRCLLFPLELRSNIMVTTSAVAISWIDKQLPFQGNTHHEADAGKQTEDVAVTKDWECLLILRFS